MIFSKKKIIKGVFCSPILKIFQRSLNIGTRFRCPVFQTLPKFLSRNCLRGFVYCQSLVHLSQPLPLCVPMFPYYVNAYYSNCSVLNVVKQYVRVFTTFSIKRSFYIDSKIFQGSLEKSQCVSFSDASLIFYQNCLREFELPKLRGDLPAKSSLEINLLNPRKSVLGFVLKNRFRLNFFHENLNRFSKKKDTTQNRPEKSQKPNQNRQRAKTSNLSFPLNPLPKKII